MDICWDIKKRHANTNIGGIGSGYKCVQLINLFASSNLH